jgi:hypothetical protein
MRGLRLLDCGARGRLPNDRRVARARWRRYMVYDALSDGRDLHAEWSERMVHEIGGSVGQRLAS